MSSFVIWIMGEFAESSVCLIICVGCFSYSMRRKHVDKVFCNLAFKSIIPCLKFLEMPAGSVPISCILLRLDIRETG